MAASQGLDGPSWVAAVQGVEKTSTMRIAYVHR